LLRPSQRLRPRERRRCPLADRNAAARRRAKARAAAAPDRGGRRCSRIACRNAVAAACRTRFSRHAAAAPPCFHRVECKRRTSKWSGAAGGCKGKCKGKSRGKGKYKCKCARLGHRAALARRCVAPLSEVLSPSAAVCADERRFALYAGRRRSGGGGGSAMSVAMLRSRHLRADGLPLRCWIQRTELHDGASPAVAAVVTWVATACFLTLSFLPLFFPTRQVSCPLDCSGHGSCDGGARPPACHCSYGYLGKACDALANGRHHLLRPAAAL
jgi:hypothetical protein